MLKIEKFLKGNFPDNFSPSRYFYLVLRMDCLYEDRIMNFYKLGQTNLNELFYLNRIKNNPETINEIPDNFKNASFYLKAFNVNPFVLCFIPEEFRTADMISSFNGNIERMIKKDPALFVYVPKEFQTKEMWLLLGRVWLNKIIKNPSETINLPKRFQNPKFFSRAIQLNDIIMRFIPTSILTKDFLISVLNSVTDKVRFISSIPDNIDTEDFYSEALKIYPSLISHISVNKIPKSFMPSYKQYILDAIKSFSFYMSKVPSELLTDDFYLKAYDLNHGVINYLPKKLQIKLLSQYVDIDKKFPKNSIYEKAKLSNIKIRCYHGTFQEINSILSSGLRSPRFLQTEEKEGRNNALDQVFVTLNKNYAIEYTQKEKFEKNYNLDHLSSRHLIELEIPIVNFLEFKILSGQYDINSISEKINSKDPYIKKRSDKDKTYLYRNEILDETGEEVLNQNDLLLPLENNSLFECIKMIYKIGELELTVEKLIPAKYIISIIDMNTNNLIYPVSNKKSFNYSKMVLWRKK